VPEEPQRPDPDALLAALKLDEARLKQGRLRVFMGMCAGVGKTYSMLEAGAKARWEGVDAVIGLVETHGRFETAALVDSLPVIPRRAMDHRGTELTEMDLEAILARKPKLVLVDELAHTNVPGSRHPKRWQDVLELLENGIDVYTTVNVQHLESRKESVEAITGVPVRETVPDSMLERADQLEVIDISPAELLERLAEGKVYPKDRAQLAAANFFKPEALTALREISLRVTAEKVDRDLQAYSRQTRDKGSWNANDRVMVAVSHSRFSESLVRAARRLASSLRAPWLAVHVSDGTELEEKSREQLRKNLALAEELGAEVLQISDGDLARALRRVAKTRDVSKLVLGRPQRGFLQHLFDGGSVLSRLTREAGDFDIHVVRQDAGSTHPGGGLVRRFEATPSQYWYTLWLVAGMAVASTGADKILGYRAVGFLFLLGLLALSLFYSLGPVLMAAVMSALIWDYFFIPPRFTFSISSSEDFLMISAYFLAAVITGLLTHRVRRNQRVLEERERRTDLMYRLVKLMSGDDMDRTLPEVAHLMERAVSRPIAVFLVGPDGKLQVQDKMQPFGLTAKELAVADWALQARKPAGWSTNNLPSGDALFIPLAGMRNSVGVLVCRATDRRLSVDDEALLKEAAQQLGLSLERSQLEEGSREADLLRESEQLHQALLNSVSHELRTPLTALLGSAAALQDEATAADATRRQAYLKAVADAGERLNRVVENLLDMARLNSGVLAPKLDWHDPAELVRLTVQSLKGPLEDRPIVMDLAPELPLVRLDYRLMEHALSNLLLNAAAYTPQGSPIHVSAKANQDLLTLTVADEGAGLPSEDLERVFDKFYRVPGSPAGGTGLGLYITRSLVRAHGGEVRAINRVQGGAAFILELPVEKAPQAPMEAA
jgi:two-component system sensor histidine kinase KdpD